MPRAEENDHLETYQRHGISEDERVYSGCKRIYSCYDWMNVKFHRWGWLCFIIALYPIVYLFGYYSGYISHCICDYNGSSET